MTAINAILNAYVADVATAKKNDTIEYLVEDGVITPAAAGFARQFIAAGLFLKALSVGNEAGMISSL